MNELILLAHVPTDSVNQGFLPAAKRLGLSVTLLTDQAEAHRRHFAGPGLSAYPEAIVACGVFNPVAVIDAIARRGSQPTAVFSNSDICKPAVRWRLPISACREKSGKRTIGFSGR